jgi:hypothetical protein
MITNISCQYLHFAQIEDIGLKSALEVKRGVLVTSARIAHALISLEMPAAGIIVYVNGGLETSNGFLTEETQIR